MPSVRTELLPDQPEREDPPRILWLPILSVNPACVKSSQVKHVNPATCRAVERTVGASVSSGGRDTFDSESMLVAPWLALLGFTAMSAGALPQAPAPE
jgi:hypothetical protein